MLQYILEVTLCWGLFYTIFFGFLRKLTFFSVNRWYLLGTMVLGILIPLLRYIELDLYQDEIAQTIPVAIAVKELPAQVAITVEEATIAWSSIIYNFLMTLYLIGVSFFGARMLRSIYRIYRLNRNGQHEDQGHAAIVYTDADHLPFSFFRHVYISRQVDLTENFEEVLQHEIAHVRSYHSVDVLLMELIQISFWFNPMVYIYKTALRQTHEYLADQAVLQNTNRKTYGTMLLKQSLSGLEIALTHRFFHSHIKKRINMMYQKKSGRSAWLKYALALPVLFVLTVVFANHSSINGTHKESQLSTNPYTCESSDIQVFTEVDQEPYFSDYDRTLSNVDEIHESAFNNLNQYLYNHISSDIELHNNVKGKWVEVNMTISQYGKIYNLSIPIGIDHRTDQKLLDLFINLNESNMPFVPAVKDGQAVSAIMTIPFFFGDNSLKKSTSQSKTETTDFLFDLSQSLSENGLINNTSRYQLHLTTDQIKINGRQVSKQVHQRYLAYFKGLMTPDYQLKKKDFLKVSVKPKFQSIQYQIGEEANTFNNEGPLPDRMMETMRAAEHRVFYFNNEEVLNRLNTELLKDGLISNKKSYQFTINSKELIIDGQKSERHQEKYENLIQNSANADLEQDFELTIRVYGNESDFILGTQELNPADHIGALRSWGKSMISSDGIDELLHEINTTHNMSRLDIIKNFYQTGIKKYPMVVVDGETKSMSDLYDLEQGEISDIEMITSASAIDKYGSQAEQGAIIIQSFQDDKIYKVVDEMPRFPGCELKTATPSAKKECSDQKLLDYIYENLKYPKAAMTDKIEGRVYIQFVIEKDGSISNTKIVRGIGGGCADAAREVIENMNNLYERWIPGKQQGKAVRVLYTLPVTFKMSNNKEPLHVIDGQIVDEATANKLNPNDIEKVTVVKGEDATNKYGAKATNGVVEITLKRKTATPEKDLQLISNDSKELKPLIVIDGKVVKHGSIEDLEPDDIKSVNVLKGEAALKKYGEKANNGVVEVELNPGATTPEKDLQLISNESKEKPLVVINGNIVKHGSVEDLDPDDIATINVVKGQAAKTKYGDKGANGVVEVIMKAGKTYQPNELDTVITFNPETFEETTMIKHRNHSHMIRDTVIVYDPETYIGTKKIIEREANREDPIDITMTYAKDKIKLTSNTAVWTELYFKIKDGKTQIIDYYGLSDDINSKAPFSFEIVKSGDDFIFRNNHGFDWAEMETNCNKWVYSNTEIKKDRIEINCF